MAKPPCVFFFLLILNLFKPTPVNSYGTTTLTSKLRIIKRSPYEFLEPEYFIACAGKSKLLTNCFGEETVKYKGKE